MEIGLFEPNKTTFPNLALMKISAWHKQRGDSVEFVIPIKHYDRIYISKVFGDEYSKMPNYCLRADEIIYGGTGFAIEVNNGREEYIQGKDSCLPKEIEHIYPDYSLYKELTKNTAYGFLTRGCPNDCAFCIVSKKEGRKSVKVADLSEFWRGQKYIKLLDPNLLACKERIDLLDQLIGSKAQVDFTQGLDARFITEEIAVKLKKVRCKMVHFAFDFMKNEKAILEGLRIYKNICEPREWEASVYMLTNFDTSIEEDLYRVRKIQECGYRPDVRIYRKNTAPKVLRDMARWCNRREVYSSCDFMDYIPRSDGKTIKQLYFGG